MTDPVEGVALVRNSTVMAAGTVVSRMLGFVRSTVLAAALGTALTGTAFTVANTVPNIIYILLAGGVLNAVLVPQLVRAMKHGAASSRAYTDGLLTVAALLLVAVTVVATLAAPLVISLYNFGSLRSSDSAVATMFAYWCLPQILFYGLYTVLGQVLTARGSFGPMMWAPIVNNLVAIVTGLSFIALFTVQPDDPTSLTDGAVAFLGAGTTLGVALQALVLLPVLRRTGFGWRPRLDVRGLGLRRTGDLARWTFLFVLVNQLAYVVIVNLGVRADVAAEEQGVGYGVGYVAYAYAYLVFLLPHSIVTVSVVTGMLPRLSSDAADGRLTDVRHQLSEAWRLTAVPVVLAAAGYVALGPDLAGVLYSGTSVEGARYIGLIVAALAVGLPAFSAQYIALRGFYAFEDTRTPFLLQCAIAATNVALALAAYAFLPLRGKMIGVAAAYALTYVLGLALSTAVLRRRVGGLDGPRVLRTYARLVTAAVPSALAGWGVSWLVARRLGDGLSGSVASLAAGGAVLLVLYLLLGRALRVRELAALATFVRARAGR
ncbi:MAG: murein biosynthesis integral membrane protein MurJ [Spirochaetaceae bacterium]|nr:murein biosynthesis integral membrane protein MurJ [Spirochaetaceae bacterium]